MRRSSIWRSLVQLPDKARLVLLRRGGNTTAATSDGDGDGPTSSAVHRNEGVAVEELGAEGLGLETRFPPSDFRFSWVTPPRTVLIVQKQGDLEPVKRTTIARISRWLIEDRQMNVIIDKDTVHHQHHEQQQEQQQRQQQKEEEAARVHPNVYLFDQQQEHDLSELSRTVDLVVALGGDGTLMQVSSLFKGHVPPVVCFAMGNLGFLMQFAIDEFQTVITSTLQGRFSFLPHMRLSCSTVTDSGRVMTSHEVMNEVVIHRGHEPHLASIDVYINDEWTTNALADGIIVATPTGSTAYSLSAGGSVIHPSVKSILLTPICPRSLSFRPAIFAPDAEILLKASTSSRGYATATLDGRDISILRPGDYIKAKASLFPVPMITRAQTHTTDWVRDINRMLKWNSQWSSR